MPDLGDEERIKLMSCLDEIRNIVGDTASDKVLVETLMACEYDMAKALDHVLNITSNESTATVPKVDFVEGKFRPFNIMWGFSD